MAKSAIARPLHILVTAGPTREYLDTVRFLSNPSSGKMGYAIAEAAARAGHEVTLVSGPVALDPPERVKLIRVTSAAEMASAARGAFVRADAAVFAAAVCDYRPVRRATRKLAKRAARFTLELEPTIDIAALLGRTKGRRVTIAFALEDHDGRSHAEAKMLRKNCDAIVHNSPQAIGCDMMRVEYLQRGQPWAKWGLHRKEEVARRLVLAVEELARQTRRRWNARSCGQKPPGGAPRCPP